MNFGIAVFPSKEVQDFANQYRMRYDTHYSRIQPHLTVRNAEEWESSKLDDMIEHLEKVTKQIKPFNIHFNRFSTFYPVSNVIYLSLSDPGPFTEMYYTVCSGILKEELRSYDHYVPHVTIGQDLNLDELHDVMSSLQVTNVNYETKVDRIHLLYQTDNLAWTGYQTFLLGN